jgi:hypothetical protein
MDAVITRIIEIEKKSAMDIDRAEDTYRKNVEAHRLTLEKNKETTHTQIISKENTRLTQALEALKKQTEEAALASGRDYESRFNNPALVEKIKEQIIAILLTQ